MWTASRLHVLGRSWSALSLRAPSVWHHLLKVIWSPLQLYFEGFLKFVFTWFPAEFVLQDLFDALHFLYSSTNAVRKLGAASRPIFSAVTFAYTTKSCSKVSLKFLNGVKAALRQLLNT